VGGDDGVGCEGYLQGRVEGAEHGGKLGESGAGVESPSDGAGVKSETGFRSGSGNEGEGCATFDNLLVQGRRRPASLGDVTA
jgi:hypothetical protein